ncbi:Cdc6 C-terminal [Trinorchestia longiramus]|nr:Cdc6 C-terminal [Trinorchestia longiramus]
MDETTGQDGKIMHPSNSSRIAQPILLEEIVSIYFEWLEELRNPEPHSMFKGFIINNLKVQCGQFILISLDESKDPKFGVARLLSCYDSGAAKDNWRGRVQWYSHLVHIPDRFRKQLPLGAAPLDLTKEVVLDNRMFADDLDLETVIGICYVTECPVETEPKSVMRPPDSHGYHHYVCRFAISRKMGCRTPTLTALSQFRKESIAPLTPYSPGKENIPPDSEVNGRKSGRKRSGDAAAGGGKKTRLSLAVPSSASRSAGFARRSLEAHLNSVSAAGDRAGEVLRESTEASSGRSNNANKVGKKKIESDDGSSEDTDENHEDERAQGKRTPSRVRNNKHEFTSLCSSGSTSSEASSNLKTPTKPGSSHHSASVSSPAVRGRTARGGTPRSSTKTAPRGTPQRAGKSLTGTPQRVVKSATCTPQRGSKSSADTPKRNGKPGSGTPQQSKRCVGTPLRRDTPSARRDLTLDSASKNFPCKECTATFRTKHQLEDHLEDEHDVYEESSDQTPSPDRKRRPSTRGRVRASIGGRCTGHVCRECGKQFSSKHKLAEHRDLDACVQSSPAASPARPKPSTGKSRRAKTSNGTVATPSKRVDEVISSLRGRHSTAATTSSSLERAKARLHVSAVPESLPCREDECQQLYDYIESKLNDRTGGCMYISGVPGTGKTATVRGVVRLLQESVDSGDVPDFTYIEVNALKLSEPRQVWVEVWKSLTGQAKVTSDHAASLLERRFRNPDPKSPPLLLLVDELDLLWTKKQDVLYRLFEWPCLPGSRLLVVTIANTMDLPERVLMARVASRLGLTRTTFHPYTHHQLQVIVQSRLEGIPGFESDAIQLVARKVAAVSGDARRALDICRRAAEIAEADHGVASSSPSKKAFRGVVGIKHVNLALTEMFTSPKIMAIRECSAVEQQVLAAVVAEYQRSGLEETSLERLHSQFLSLCAFDGKLKHISLSNVILAVNRLSARRLLITETPRRHLAQRISLNISVQDVKFALDCAKRSKVSTSP